jgi:hypothetical protein
VRGLSGLQYYDNTDGVDMKPESGEAVSINGETDRIYRSAGNTIVVGTPYPPSLPLPHGFFYLPSSQVISI